MTNIDKILRVAELREALSSLVFAKAQARYIETAVLREAQMTGLETAAQAIVAELESMGETA